MKKFDLRVTMLLFVLLSFSLTNIQSQSIGNNKKIIPENENYSKTDWEGQGIFRDFKPSDELIEKRSRTAKHFRNPDNTITAIITNGSSINYEEKGAWITITREIENNYSGEFSRYPFSNTHNSFKSYYPGTCGQDGIMTILNEGAINEWINPQMYYIVNNEKIAYQNNYSSAGEVDDNEIIYKNIYDNIDVKFIQNNDSRKMDIILNNPDALINAPSNASDLVFEETIKLPEKWTVIEEKGSLNLYDDNHVWIARYEKPSYYDSYTEADNNTAKHISGSSHFSKVGNDLIISTFVPLQWLRSANRKYPVNIDPTVNIYPANSTYYSGYVTYGGGSKNNDSLYQVSYTCYGFVKFDLQAISTVTNVTSASLNLYCPYRASNGTTIMAQTLAVNVDPVTSSASAIWHDNGLNVLSYGGYCAPCWYNWTLNPFGINDIFSRRTSPGWTGYELYLLHNNGDYYNFYGYGNSTYKPYLTVTYCETPGTPLNLLAIVNSTTTANLTWVAGIPTGSPVLIYCWQVFTTGGTLVTSDSTISLTAAVSTLSPGTSYYFRVRTLSTCDTTYSAWATSQNFVTYSNNCTTPGTPVGLTSVPGQTTATLSWIAGTPAGSPTLSYYWQVYTTGGTLVTGGSTSGLTAVANGLTCASMYYFKVHAYTSCDGSASAWAANDYFTTSGCCTTPGAPVSLSSLVVNQTTVALQWLPGIVTGSPNITYYWEVYNSGGILITSGLTTGTSAVITVLSCGHTYYFRVRAGTSCDNSFSSWANSSNFTTTACSCITPGTPVNLISNATSSSSANLSWTGGSPAGSPVISYFWELYTTGGNYITGGNPSSPNATVNGLSCGTMYYFRVKAFTTCDSSSSSWIQSADFSTLISLPVPPSSITSNTNNICPGSVNNITLSSAGGSGNIFAWYGTSCGVNIVGTGTIINLPAPLVTTTYFGRWESTCGLTSCLSFTISVLAMPNPPDTVKTDNNYFCSGAIGNLNLSVSGGSGTNVSWFTGACGTTFTGTGASITVPAPSSNITYYVRWQNNCGNSSCLSLSVIVIVPFTPTSLLAFPSTISCGSNTNLSASTSTGIIRWWDAATGGNFIGTSQSGTFLNVFPVYTTAYYAESFTGVYGSLTFNYTGAVQTFSVPAGVTAVSIDASGASGGAYSNYTPGLGGRIQTNLSVAQGQKLNVYVGSQGTSTGTGGWNGGGSGSNAYCGGGGGESDIRVGGTGLLNRIIVAGAGGGSAGYSYGTGGGGGGSTGGNGLYNNAYNSSYCGGGGGPSSGGAGAAGGGGIGAQGIGGNGSNYGGAGGGGYFGGGGGYSYGGGGGGSSWITGTGTSNTISTQGYNAGDGIVIISWTATNCSSPRASVTVTVTSIPPLPVAIASPQTITCGAVSNLNAVSAGSTIRWWDATTGGNMLGSVMSGTNFSVSPSITSSYYADASQGFCTTPRASVTVNVLPLPSPSSIYANPDTVLCGGNSILSASSSSGIIRWWDSSAGGNLLATGIAFTVSPLATTTFYAETYSAPCVSLRIATTVNVLTLSPPSSVTAIPNSIICGGTTNLSAVSGSGLVRWWDAATSGNLLGTSQNGNALTLYPPAGTTTYYAENYSLTQVTQIFNYQTSSIITWTIPAGVTGINIDARGASGGYMNNAIPGHGARMTGYFSVNPGDLLFILVGQSLGLTTNFPGGGGGTFVSTGTSYYSSAPLIVAGGGGGAASGNGVDAPTGTSGTGTNAGTNGYGATASACGGGGGGFYSSGASDNYNYFPGGSGFYQGGAGACYSGTQCGGYGGGATADYNGSCNTEAGAGGGYSGGSGNNTSLKYYGEAGGSFNIGANQVNTGGFNNGNGSVIISWYQTLCVSSRTGVTVNVTGAPVINTLTATPDTVSCGYSALLNAVSTGNNIVWWDSPSGGNIIGTSANAASFAVSPFSNTTYYAEAYINSCNSTRIPITVYVTPISAPSSVLAIPATISCGGNTNLYAVSSTGFVRWWDAITSGNIIGSTISGAFLNVYPSGTTAYYAEDYVSVLGSQTFSYTGGLQNWVVPAGINVISVDASGAQGNCNSGNYGGTGGRVQTNLSVIQGQIFYIYIGGQNTRPNGGWNGGGSGGTSNGGGGGGATDIRLGGTSLINRMIVAGGGGGGYSSGYVGGAGGGLSGSNGLYGSTYNGIYCGGGGTQTGGGTAATYFSSGTPAVQGSIGTGGNAASYGYGGGGGGGYYGGGGGSIYGGGGGGSSWVNSSLTSNTVNTTGYRSGNGQMIISWNGTGCISLRTSVIVTVTSSSATPVSVTAVPPTINCGDSTQLSAIDTGGIIKWWNSPTGGIFLGTSQSGAVFTVTPSGTSTYYAEGFNLCASATRISITVTVNSIPPPTNITANMMSICLGSQVVLSATSTNGIIRWWSSPSGGTMIGTSASGAGFYVYPSINTAYYAESFSFCPSATRISITISILSNSNIASSIVVTPPTICSGNTVTLSESGGSLGSNARWFWYTANCGAVFFATGSTVTSIPSTTSEYWLRAEGQCNTTSCLSIIVNVAGLSSPGTAISSVPLSVCSGNSSTLSISGGTLGSGAHWYWYSGLCGSNLSGVGSTVVVSPSASAIYFARAEGDCNTTACISVAINISLNSVAPTSGISSPSNICAGSSSTLSISGGSLGTGAFWNWFLSSCGGLHAGSGVSIIQSPTVNTNYYVRGEGNCNTTSCLSITVSIVPVSIAASSAIAYDSTICSGTTDTLFASGGSLAPGADWFWYSGACAGNYSGTGANLAIIPSASTTYYLRAEGPCSTTSCVSIYINVGNSVVQPAWAASDRNNYCSNTGGNLTLSISGGYGTTVMWYKVSCGGTVVGTGNPKVITAPAQSTTFYARWQIPGCSSSTCVSRTVTVLLSPTSPVSLICSNNNICTNTGGTITISGSGGVGTSFGWYSGSCGGTALGTGRNLTVPVPSVSTVYWSRLQTVSCGNSPCKTIDLVVNTLSSPADSIYSVLKTICSGDQVNLSVSGGNLGSGSSWNWFTGSCSGSYLTSGSMISQNPSITTTYFVSANGPCNTTSCASISIKVNSVPDQPSLMVGNTNPQPGNSEQYYVTPDSTASSYTWSCPSGWSGAGITNSITFIVGNSLGPITVTPSNSCGSGLSRTLDIDGSFTIKGNFYYNASVNPLDSIWAFLSLNGSKIDSIRTDSTGFYQFSGVVDGAYNITAATIKPWAGVNATDAIKVKRHFVGSELFTSSIRLHAADVNLSYFINVTDAVKITRRFVGSDTSFTRGDWIFEKPTGGDTINVSTYVNDTVVVNGTDITQNFEGICVGDVNASNMPPFKSDNKVSLEYFGYNELMKLKSGEAFEIPLISTSDFSAGAISLVLKYPKELMTVDKVILPDRVEENNLMYNMYRNELRIGWFENEHSLLFRNDNPVLIILGRTTTGFTNGSIIRLSLADYPASEFADDKGDPIQSIILKTYEFGYSDSQYSQTIESDSVDNLYLYPNPASGIVNIRYTLSNNGLIRISLNNILGQKVIDVVDQYRLKGEYYSEFDISGISPGVYYLTMLGKSGDLIIKRLDVVR